MVKHEILLLSLIFLFMNVNCNGGEMEEKKRKEFLSTLTKQSKITNFEKQDIDLMIKKFNREPLYKLKSEKNNNFKDVIRKIVEEYKDYEIFYQGPLGSRRIILAGKPYKFKSCLKSGVFYDLTNEGIKKIAEFNNNGLFFYFGKNQYLLPDPQNNYFYVVMLQDKIKRDELVVDFYGESLVYGAGYKWWYDDSNRVWKWKMIYTWF